MKKLFSFVLALSCLMASAATFPTDYVTQPNAVARNVVTQQVGGILLRGSNVIAGSLQVNNGSTLRGVTRGRAIQETILGTLSQTQATTAVFFSLPQTFNVGDMIATLTGDQNYISKSNSPTSYNYTEITEITRTAVAGEVYRNLYYAEEFNDIAAGGVSADGSIWLGGDQGGAESQNSARINFIRGTTNNMNMRLFTANASIGGDPSIGIFSENRTPFGGPLLTLSTYSPEYALQLNSAGIFTTRHGISNAVDLVNLGQIKALNLTSNASPVNTLGQLADGSFVKIANGGSTASALVGAGPTISEWYDSDGFKYMSSYGTNGWLEGTNAGGAFWRANTNGAIAVSADGRYSWDGRSYITSRADSFIDLLEADGVGFTQLGFGGSSSSFPAIRRVSGDFQFVLADNSEFTSLTALGYTIRATAGNVGSGSLVFHNRLLLNAPADGRVQWLNAAGTGFDRMMFGGTTASFPALKRNGAGLDVRLADDSANGLLTIGNFTATGDTHIYGTGNGQYTMTIDSATTNLILRPSQQASPAGLTIGPLGYVGIGKSAPTNTFDLVGTATFTGNININGNTEFNGPIANSGVWSIAGAGDAFFATLVNVGNAAMGKSAVTTGIRFHSTNSVAGQVSGQFDQGSVQATDIARFLFAGRTNVVVGTNTLTLTTNTSLAISSGINERMGEATLVNGTVTVNNTAVTASTRVFPAFKTVGGTTAGILSYTVSAGTSFTITSVSATGTTVATDTSLVSYWLVDNP